MYGAAKSDNQSLAADSERRMGRVRIGEGRSQKVAVEKDCKYGIQVTEDQRKYWKQYGATPRPLPCQKELKKALRILIRKRRIGEILLLALLQKWRELNLRGKHEGEMITAIEDLRKRRALAAIDVLGYTIGGEDKIARRASER